MSDSGRRSRLVLWFRFVTTEKLRRILFWHAGPPSAAAAWVSLKGGADGKALMRSRKRISAKEKEAAHGKRSDDANPRHQYASAGEVQRAICVLAEKLRAWDRMQVHLGAEGPRQSREGWPVDPRGPGY